MMASHTRRAPPDRVVTASADRRTTILETIRGAKRRLSLSLFRCNDEEIFAEIARAVARGVAVEVLTTTRAKGGRKRIRALWKALDETGATVHAYADPVVKYHAKYLVADDGPALVATLNFTRKCFSRTWDALVVTYDPEVVAGLQQLMAADRDGRPLPDPLSPRLIVGPERARQQLFSIIERAESRIRLIDAKVSDPAVTVLMNARRENGVNVEIIGSKRLGDLKSHGKIMLVDNQIAVIGSLALAALSLDFRREVAIIVDEPAAVAEINQLFETISAIVAAPPIAGDATSVSIC
jgi:cardiolipin synthase